MKIIEATLFALKIPFTESFSIAPNLELTQIQSLLD